MTTSVQPQRRSREARPTATRDRLVLGARQCVRERGIVAASSRAISDAAGANLGAITYYFGSKDELLAVALAEELEAWLREPLRTLAGPGDPARRMLDAVQALVGTFEQLRVAAPALLDAFLHAAREPDMRVPLARAWLEVRARLATTIDALQRDRLVPPWVNADAMAALILAVGAGTVVGSVVDPTGPVPFAIAAQFAQLLLSSQAQQ
jgi:AcrR family transcriptional regulator